MSVLKNIFETIIEALFPLSVADRKVLSLSPEQALATLPKAPALPIKNAYSVFAYKNEVVSKLIWQIKYKKSAKAFSIGGFALFEKLKEFNKPLTIIPIPITSKRRAERGFNQCELLTEEIARLDKENIFIIVNDLLTRIHHDDRQTLKGRSERIESAKHIFGINSKIDIEKFKDTTIVIIDDVITTGSTMNEAMETLKSSGFKEVYGVSIAH